MRAAKSRMTTVIWGLNFSTSFGVAYYTKQGISFGK